MTHIELNRTFSSISKTEAKKSNEDLDEYLKYLSSIDGKAWSEILINNRTVILAKAGAGKTEELKFISNKLRQNGESSFFLRLENIDSLSDFELAFEIGNYSEFESWLDSNKHAFLFLDSIDEAKLKDYRQFSKALNILGKKLGEHKRRVRIFITSRPSEWNDIRDREYINQYLGVQSQDKIDSSGLDKLKTNDTNGFDLNLLYLNSLTFDKVSMFIKGNHVTNENSLISELDLKQEDLINDTPKDLIEIISFWDAHGKIGSRLEMIEESIKNSLLEDDPNRSTNLPISQEKIQNGVELLAASATFTKRSKISTLEHLSNNSLKDIHMNPKHILNKWDENDIRSLLHRRVFENEIYSTVRFDHRSIREFLTAKWINKLLNSGFHREELENLFIKNKYGQEVVTESLSSILAWVVIFDNKLLQRVIATDPVLLLKEGDASQFNDDVKIQILESLIKFTKNIYLEPISFYQYELQRISTPALSETIITHLNKYKKLNSVAFRLLLDIAGISRITTASEIILKIILDKNVKPFTRRKAITAISKCGSEDIKEQVLYHFLENIDTNDKDSYGTLIICFSPNYLKPEQVIGIFKQLPKDSEYGSSSFDYNFRKFIDVSSDRELIILINGFYKLINEKPYIDNDGNISEKYSWLLSYTLKAIKKLILSRNKFILEGKCLAIINLLSVAKSYNISHLGSENDFKKHIHKWKELNYALFWKDISVKRVELKIRGERLVLWYQSRSSSQAWALNQDDFEYFFRQIKLQKLIDNKLLSQSICFHLDSNQSKNALIKDACQTHSELITVYNKHMEILASTPKESKYEVAEKERKLERAQKRSKDIQRVEENISELQEQYDSSDGKLYLLQNYLMNEMRKLSRSNTSKWGLPNWRDLESEFGRKVANSFKIGAINYWRGYTPELLSEKQSPANRNQTTSAIVFGLTGLAIETSDCDEWIEKFSKSDVIKATKYALNEMNGFPDWFQTLFNKFSFEVLQIIVQEIKWELTQFKNEDDHYILSNIIDREKWLIPKVANKVLEILTPESLNTIKLKTAMELFISCNDFDKETFINLANTKLLQDSLTDNHFALWLSTLMCVEAHEEHLKLLKDKLETFYEDKKDLPPCENTQAVEYIQKFLVYLVGSRSGNIQYIQKSYQRNPKILLGLIKTSCLYMPSSKDVNRLGGGVYSPDIRDESQDAREYLTQLLRNITGKESYDALITLSKSHPDPVSKKYYKNYAVQKAIKDAEFTNWKVQDVLRFNNRFQPEYQESTDTYDNLTKEIISSLQKLQGNKIYWNDYGEVPRNRYIFDMLCSAKINATQEKPWSISSKGINDGEVDIFVCDNHGNPFSIVEALNLENLKRSLLKKHLDKVFSYDANGLKENHIITYSNSPNFEPFWIRYFNHIKNYKFQYELMNLFEINTNISGLKQAKSEHSRNGKKTILNHLFLNLHL